MVELKHKVHLKLMLLSTIYMAHFTSTIIILRSPFLYIMVALTAAACAFHVLEPAIDTWHGMGKLVVPVGLRRVASPSLALAGLGLGGMGGRCASCLRRRAHSQILYCTACMVARACDRWDGTAQRSHGRIGTPPAIGRRRVGVQVTVHACT